MKDEEQWVAWISKKKPALHQPNLMGHLSPNSKGQGGIEYNMQGSRDQERWRRTVGLKISMGKEEERHFPHGLFS